MRAALQPSLDPTDYAFEHDIRVRFAETDAMGIVHHAAYLPYLEEARVEYLRHIGRPYQLLRATGTDIAVLEVAVRYRRPLRFDEVVRVHLAAGEGSRTTFQIAYLLERDGTPCATAVTVHGCVTSDGRPARLPNWLTQMAGDRPRRQPN